ncbi:MAG: FUSC family protein [Roseiarcus sp.]|jgi:uncharacterized membrane protein YccC
MFGRENLLHAVRILAACALAYGGSLLIGLAEGYWALITAVVVTQPALGDTLALARDRLVGTLIGAVVGLGILEAAPFAPSPVLFWIGLAPLALLTAIRPNLRLCCITLAIVVLLPPSGAPYVRPLQRIAEILLGTLASVAVTAALPKRPAPRPE